MLDLGLVINCALVRTLFPRLAAGLVLDNHGNALLRLKSPREQLDVLVVIVNCVQVRHLAVEV